MSKKTYDLDQLAERLRTHQEKQAEYRGGLENVEAQMKELGIEDPEQAADVLEKEKEKATKLLKEKDELAAEATALLEEYEDGTDQYIEEQS